MVFFCKCGSLVLPSMKCCPKCGENYNEDDQYDDEIDFEFDFPQSEIKTPKTIDKEFDEAPYFPYTPRNGQLNIVKDIVTALESDKHIVMESGTGTGKTILSLSSALQYAVPREKRIIYLTRTVSQSDQVMRELKSISKLKNVTGVSITGRGKSCPLMRGKGYGDTDSAMFAIVCENKKSLKQCKYYNGLRKKYEEFGSELLRGFYKSDEIDNYCENHETCPYEMKKMLMKDADVVVAPYIHILSEDLRTNLLRNMDTDSEKILLVIDEAHNLIDAARVQESFSISMRLIESAIDECTTLKNGDAPLLHKVKLKDFLTHLKQTIKNFGIEKLGIQKTEELIGPGELEDSFYSKYDIGLLDMTNILTNMLDIGEERTKMLLEKGENDVSKIGILADALVKWIESEDDKFVRSIRSTEDGEVLHASCIDPFDVIQFLRSQKCAIHMSGTLKPLDQYIKLLRLPNNTVSATYPSPFPKENKKVIYMSNVTTKYDEMQNDPSIFSRIEKNVAKMCNHVNKNTLVFFPSYGMMQKMRPFLERDIKKPLYWEEKEKRRTMESLNSFRKGRNGVFVSVMGGSISEGIDFPGEELCFAIIIGIPFPPPSLDNKKMSETFDKKFGPWMGWKYTSLTPALRKMNQAIGRLIRTETDKGMAVIMDNRAGKYAKELDAVLSTTPFEDVVKFFDETEFS